MNAIEVLHASKIYRRYSRKRQFATLKSALLSGSLIRDLQPGRDVRRRSGTCPSPFPPDARSA